MGKLRALVSGQSRQSAFEHFIVAHFDALYRRAHRLARNADDAEDLVQELCIRAHHNFDDLRKMDNPRGWLLRVLYRLFVDVARHNASSPVRPLDVAEEHDYSLEIACAEPGPAEEAETELLRRRLHRAMSYLARDEQALLVLHEVEGCSLAEIEKITDLPQSTLKSRLHRARVKLGRLMQHRKYGSTHDEARGSDHELPRRHQSVG